MGKLRRQFNYKLRGGVVDIEGQVPVGSGGAVGTVEMPGVTSVVRNDTGDFTVNFDEQYTGLAHFCAGVETGASGADGYTVQLVDSQYVDGGYPSVNSGDGYAQIEVLNTAGSKADPISCKLWLHFSMKTSTVGSPRS